MMIIDRSFLLLVSLASMSMAASLGVFWSEWAVLQTGCGPMSMPDWLERSCYLGVLVVSGISVFTRIVLAFDETQEGGLAYLLLLDGTSDSGRTTKTQSTIRLVLQTAEYLALLAVLGAVLVLGNQVLNGESMDGMSGIDLDKCRTRQSFQQNV